MNWLTATVTIRPLAILAGRTAPARSTWAMIQPPKMSPLPLASAGIGITRMTSWRSFGRASGAMPDPTARASSLEISGILLHLQPASADSFTKQPADCADLDATRCPLHAAAGIVRLDAQGREPVRLAHPHQADSVRMGVALAGADRALLPGRRQARQHRRAADPEEPRRRAGAQARRPAQRPRRAGRDPGR